MANNISSCDDEYKIPYDLDTFLQATNQDNFQPNPNGITSPLMYDSLQEFILDNMHRYFDDFTKWLNDFRLFSSISNGQINMFLTNLNGDFDLLSDIIELDRINELEEFNDTLSSRYGIVIKKHEHEYVFMNSQKIN